MCTQQDSNLHNGKDDENRCFTLNYECMNDLGFTPSQSGGKIMRISWTVTQDIRCMPSEWQTLE